MAQVTVEGSSITPSTFLAPGARVTVEHTKYIANLIKRGYVNLIQIHEPIHESGPVFVNDFEPEDDAPEIGPDSFGTPPESAAKSVWSEFLTEHGVSYPDGATKAQMIEAWWNRGDAPSVD